MSKWIKCNEKQLPNLYEQVLIVESDGTPKVAQFIGKNGPYSVSNAWLTDDNCFLDLYDVDYWFAYPKVPK